MRFASLFALAVFVSISPSFAAPAPYAPHRANSKRDTTTTNVTGIARGQNSTVESASLGTDFIKLLTDAIPEIKQLLAANGTTTTSAMASKRATSDILQEIEAVLESFLKRDSIEATAPDHTGEHSRRTTTPKIASSEVSNISSWLKNLGNIFSIGTGGLAIAGAVDGSFSSNNTKREIEQAYNRIDLAALLDGATPQFNDRRSTTPKISSSEVPEVSSSEVSSLESGLSKLADIFSFGGTVASLVPVFEGSSNSSGISIKRSDNDAIGSDSPDSFILSAEEKRSITSDILGELVSFLGGVIGESGSGSGISIKRSASSNPGAPSLTDLLTPQELRELQQMLSE